MEIKLVTYKNLKMGQEIKGHENEGSSSSYIGYVKAINPAFVTITKWRKDGREEKINSASMFKVEMTEEEFNSKYLEKAKEVLRGFKNKLRKDEIGYHEMWNAWLYGTPYEIASHCVKNNMMVVGYSTDIFPKIVMLSGDRLDAGVCAEYETGERIWCHFRTEDIKKMLEDYKELLG